MMKPFRDSVCDMSNFKEDTASRTLERDSKGPLYTSSYLRALEIVKALAPADLMEVTLIVLLGLM